MSSSRLTTLGTLYIIIFSVLIAGCSGGGGNGPLATPGNAQTGAFRDSAVSGLYYSTFEWKGYTDDSGSFNFQAGENITFSVGSVILGTTPAKKNITPIDLVPGAVDATNPTVINICRFLISLDDDGNPNNGIKISERARNILADFSFNFNDPLDTNPDVTRLFDELNNNGIPVGEESSEQHQYSLVSEEGAIQHFENTLFEIEQEEIEAEDVILTAGIVKPQLNVFLIQGQTIPIEGAAFGGSKQYTFSWVLKNNSDETKIFEGVYPPGILPSLSPGNYTLILTAEDSDGNSASDQRLITVVDQSNYGTIPAKDEMVRVSLVGPENLIVKAGESISIKAEITKGNPPFFYDWDYPEQARYSYSDNPLNATFTFNSSGLYRILIFVKDSINNDYWAAVLPVTVED